MILKTMRQPSIHITEEQLTDIMASIFEDFSIKANVIKVARAIMMKSSKRPCRNRVITISDKKLDDKIKKVLKSSRGDALFLSQIIHGVRISLKHHGISKIEENGREWDKVKKLAEICNQFCNDFRLSKKEGYTEFVKIGLGKISSRRNILDKLLSMQEGVSLHYDAIQKVRADKHSSETRQIHDMYVSKISMYTGIVNKFHDNPVVYLNFVRVREITEELNVDPAVYLEAQFHGLLWTDSYPEPTQLITEKSKERLNQYLYENKLTTKPKEEVSVNGRNLLKKIKNDNNRG